MSRQVKISADSICDLPQELCDRFDVRLIPLHVELDGVSYSDRVDIQTADIFRIYEEKKILPKTSAISIGEYEDWFRGYREQGVDVIHFCTGSGLSSSYQNACIAAEEMDGVYVMDSCNLSSGVGLLVLAAAERAQAGMETEQIVREVTALISKCEASFVIDTLEFLYKGGRCSALAMLGANMLKLKPCIEVDNSSGKMSVSKKYRGSIEKVLEQYVRDRLEGRTDLDLHRIFITTSSPTDELNEKMLGWVKQYARFEEYCINSSGCTISSHCGPNSAGILFFTK